MNVVMQEHSPEPMPRDKTRSEACQLAEQALSCWSDLFPHILAVATALNFAIEFAEGGLDITNDFESITTARVLCIDADRYCRDSMREAGPSHIGRYYAARKAVQAVMLTLADEVDLEAVQLAVVEALRYSGRLH